MIESKAAFSGLNNVDEAFEDLCNQLGDDEPKLIIFSSEFSMFKSLTEAFSKEFPTCTVIGTSSYVQFCDKGCSTQGAGALAIYKGIECASGVLLDAAHYPMRYSKAVTDAVDRLSDTENTICMEFSSAFCGCEETIQDTFRTLLAPRGIPVFGGSAGCNPTERNTAISLDGKIYEEASVFVFIKNLGGKIRVFKENLFKPTAHFFTATDVDCDERAVYEFDEIPATEAYANALNVPVDKIEEAREMHPLGRISDKEIYIAEICETDKESGRITCYSRIYNRTKLAVMEVDDMDEVWDDTAKRVKEEIPTPSLSLCVNCTSRASYFVKEGRLEDFNNKLKDEYGTFFGISGFGEQTNYEHLNMSFLIAAFE